MILLDVMPALTNNTKKNRANIQEGWVSKEWRSLTNSIWPKRSFRKSPKFRIVIIYKVSILSVTKVNFHIAVLSCIHFTPFCTRNCMYVSQQCDSCLVSRICVTRRRIVFEIFLGVASNAEQFELY